MSSPDLAWATRWSLPPGTLKDPPALPAARTLPEVRDPVCGLTFPEEDAAALGAFVVERGGQRHYLCSAACRDAFLGRGR